MSMFYIYIHRIYIYIYIYVCIIYIYIVCRVSQGGRTPKSSKTTLLSDAPRAATLRGFEAAVHAEGHEAVPRHLDPRAVRRSGNN